MTRPATVAITGLGLWTPGYVSADAWARGAHDPELPKPTGLGLDRINRRRAGHMGRSIADSATQAMEQAGVDPASVATVVGSSIGEASTMISLLEQMWRTKEPMSPAAFTVSVHNAASGLLSISSKNLGYTTSLAADENTPAVALLEGIGLVLDRGAPALVVCSDESAPVCLVEDSEPWELLSAAVVLAPVEEAANSLATLEVVREGEALAPTKLDPLMIHNPQVGLLDLIDAVQKRSAGLTRLDRGTGLGYLAKLTFDSQ